MMEVKCKGELLNARMDEEDNQDKNQDENQDEDDNQS